jgi:ABC-type phosphate/phosphonate transport system substrate-binding protein
MTDTTIIFETFLASTQYKSYLYITEYVERYVNVPTFLLNGEVLEDFGAGYADAGFIGTTAFMQLLGQNPCPVELIAAPLMRHEDTPPTFFDIVVYNESPYMTLGDLNGCIWASCVQKPRIEDCVIDEPVISAVDFTDTIEATSQAQLLRLLLDRKAHAAAIDARIMDIVQHNSPRIAAQLRILGTYCISAGPLVAIASRINAALKQKIQEAFLTMHLHPFYAQRLQEEAIERFIPVTNPRYQRVREHYWQVQTPTHLAELEAKVRVSASTL